MSGAFRVRFEGRVITSATDGTELTPDERAEALEEHLGTVMEKLLELDAVDPAIEGSLEAGDVSITVTVDAGEPFDATESARVLIRTAIHAAGGDTPDFAPLDSSAWSLVVDQLNVTRETVPA